MVSKEQIWQVLKSVQIPGFERNVVGIVQELVVGDEGEVTISLAIGHLGRAVQQATIAAVERAVRTIPGVGQLNVEVAEPLPPPLQRVVEVPERPGIRYVLAVGSGKGGVGKSTVSVNLAVALAQQGLRVGLMDADVYGPNVPRMMGVEALPARQDGQIEPAEAYGVRLVSVGFMVQRDQAVVWRGPMTDKIVRQFVQSVDWGELDVLVVDLPPSTGDIALALAKHARPDGAVAVVTPQEVALDDVRKAISMFRRLNVPVLGVVENMSYFECDVCGTRHALFGSGGGQRLAEAAGVELLGQIPFEPVVREGGDVGQPSVLRPDSWAGAALREVAERVWQAVKIRDE
ncbi:MAG TPA: Mrp/NBP35 family ATP-binding protein [Ardenticatenaceae bacterium]|nr:Mrp/NBP35 family ATP-binding protein [Ardenticatenaceae bacterium]